MHYHVMELMRGRSPSDVTGTWMLAYPCERPAFRTIEGAVDAVMSVAFARWGFAAELHVEVALNVEISLERQHSYGGAVAGWSEWDDTHTSWSVCACGCVDGTVAEIFTHHVD